jgi:septal ring factor EnvC (AmiA/AmiB activator)
MLCVICSEEIHKEDEIKCYKCIEFLHFGCASFREPVFRKLTNVAKENWSCSICKNSKNIIKNKEKTSSFSDTTIENLVKSVDFMSKQFDSFKVQMKDFLSALSNLQTESKSIKQQNIKLTEDVSLLNKRLNILEQKMLENNIEIVGVPEA